MEFRLVRLSDTDEYIQIYDEKTSELIGSIIKTRHMLVARRYILRYGDSTYYLSQHPIFRRSWKIKEEELSAKIKFKLFGRGMELKVDSTIFSCKEPIRGKITLKNNEGRTGYIVDLTAFSSADMILVETYDRLSPEVMFLAIVSLMDRYDFW